MITKSEGKLVMHLVSDESLTARYKLVNAMETNSPGEVPNEDSDGDEFSQHGLVIDESCDMAAAQPDTALDQTEIETASPPNAVVKNGRPEIVNMGPGQELGGYMAPAVVSPNRHDRMRLRPWLVAQIDSGDYPGLAWLNDDKSLFRIPWMHRSKREWKFQHSSIFVEWAKHTGKFRPGIDTPDFVHMKTRLRCAFNKAPDIEEVAGIQKVKHDVPHKIYRLLPPGSNKFANMPEKPESERTIYQRNRKRRKMAEKSSESVEISTGSPPHPQSPAQDSPKIAPDTSPANPIGSPPIGPPLVGNGHMIQTNQLVERDWTNQTVMPSHVIMVPTTDTGSNAKNGNSAVEVKTSNPSGNVVSSPGIVVPVPGNVVPVSASSSNVIYIYQNGMVMAAMPQQEKPTMPSTPEALPAFEQLLSTDIPGPLSEQDERTRKKTTPRRRKSVKAIKDMPGVTSPIVVPSDSNDGVSHIPQTPQEELESEDVRYIDKTQHMENVQTLDHVRRLDYVQRMDSVHIVDSIQDVDSAEEEVYEEKSALPPSLGDVVGGLLSLGNKGENLPIHTEILDLRIKEDDTKPVWDGTGVLDLSCVKKAEVEVEDGHFDNKQETSLGSAKLGSPKYEDEKSPDNLIQGWSVTPEGLQTRFNELIDLENKLMDYKVALDSRAEMLASKETELERRAADIIQKEANFEMRCIEFEKRVEEAKQRDVAIERQELDWREREVQLKTCEKQLSLKEELIACREKRLKLELESMMTSLSGHSSMLVMGPSSGPGQATQCYQPGPMVSSRGPVPPMIAISNSAGPVQIPTGTPMVRPSVPYSAMPRPQMLPGTHPPTTFAPPQMLSPQQSAGERARMSHPVYSPYPSLPMSSRPGMTTSRVLPGPRPSPRAAIVPIQSQNPAPETTALLKPGNDHPASMGTKPQDERQRKAESGTHQHVTPKVKAAEQEMTSEPLAKRQKLARNETKSGTQRAHSEPLCSEIESVEQLKEIEASPIKKRPSFIAKSSRTNNIIQNLKNRIIDRSKSESPPTAPPDPTFNNMSMGRILPPVNSQTK